MGLLEWLYSAFRTLLTWGDTVFQFATTNVRDALMSVGVSEVLVQLVPDCSVFELFFGAGIVFALSWILASWIIDLLP